MINLGQLPNLVKVKDSSQKSQPEKEQVLDKDHESGLDQKSQSGQKLINIVQDLGQVDKKGENLGQADKKGENLGQVDRKIEKNLGQVDEVDQDLGQVDTVDQDLGQVEGLGKKLDEVRAVWFRVSTEDAIEMISTAVRGLEGGGG